MSELASAFRGNAREIVDLSDAQVNLARSLGLPDGLRHIRSTPDEASQRELGPHTLLIAVVGPTAPAQVDPDALAPVLRRFSPGARAILLMGWPIPELPYHRLLGPLADARCQVTQAVPLDRSRMPVAHCALVVECVDKLAPVGAYLSGIPSGIAGDEPPVEAADDLRPLLRMVNEYVLAGLVARPLRRRLSELERAEAERAHAIARALQLENAVAERDDAMERITRLTGEMERARREIDELGGAAADRDAQVRLLRNRLRELESSVPFEVGQAVVDGARHPARAVVSVPRELIRVWRKRKSRLAPSGSAPATPVDLMVPIALPKVDSAPRAADPADHDRSGASPGATQAAENRIGRLRGELAGLLPRGHQGGRAGCGARRRVQCGHLCGSGQHRDDPRGRCLRADAGTCRGVAGVRGRERSFFPNRGHCPGCRERHRHVLPVRQHRHAPTPSGPGSASRPGRSRSQSKGWTTTWPRRVWCQR